MLSHIYTKSKKKSSRGGLDILIKVSVTWDVPEKLPISMAKE